jgi:predicted RND superfamily exporter protein
MEKFAEFCIKKKNLVLGIILLITLFFGYHITRLKIKTVFDDLLPQGHEYIKVHNKFRRLFGGGNHVTIIVQVKEGDIFNKTTLGKIRYISEELYKVPAVDRFKVLSIGVTKMKKIVIDAQGFRVVPVMKTIPETEEEMKKLRLSVYGNEMCYGPFVSFDSKKAMITADFFDEEIDYKVVFKELSRIRKETEDDNNIVAIAGEPMHYGYIRENVTRVNLILIGTVAIIVVILYFYFRSKRGVIIPIVTAGVSGVWGLGFMSLMGYNLDPLVLVLPFLISLMTARHSMQLCARFLEEYGSGKSINASSQIIISSMFIPGLTSIVTDCLGIALVAVAPIPILQKVAITCAFWSIATTVLALILTPILLAYIPESKRLAAQLAEEERKKKRETFLDRSLPRIGRWIVGKGKWVVITVSVLLTIWGFIYSERLIVGDMLPGSNLLWPFHRYNIDGFRISFAMPVLCPLYIMIEGDQEQSIDIPNLLREIYKFQGFIRNAFTGTGRVMFIQSVISTFPGAQYMVKEGNPNWYFFPLLDEEVLYSFRRTIYGAEPGDIDKYLDGDERYTNIVVFCRDKTGTTIKMVIDKVKEFIEKQSFIGKGTKVTVPSGKESNIRYSLAGGAIGVQAAVNEVINASQLWNLILALGGVFLCVMIQYRSMAAGLILTIPLAISNLICFALMGVYQIGLTVSTYPVSSVGVGLGVDYGIYYLSRLQEEMRDVGDLNQAIINTLKSNGKSIVMIATTLTIGLVFWLFSTLRFQAWMGALLAVLLFCNMLGALFLVPTLVAIFKPKFVTKVKKIL